MNKITNNILSNTYIKSNLGINMFTVKTEQKIKTSHLQSILSKLKQTVRSDEEDLKSIKIDIKLAYQNADPNSEYGIIQFENLNYFRNIRKSIKLRIKKNVEIIKSLKAILRRGN